MNKRILSVFCLVLLVSLVCTGCFATSLEGKWQGVVELSDLLNQQLAKDDADTFPGLQFVSIQLPVTVEFTADGRCIFSFEDEDVQSMAATMIDQMLPALEAKFEDMGMSLEDILEISGLTKNEALQKMAQGMMQSMDLSSLSMTLKYKTENGLMYIGNDLDSATGIPYTIRFNRMTFDFGKEGESDLLFPLTLKKIN